MHQITANYIINQSTTALLPAHQIEYDTIAFEQNKQFFIRKPALQLIKEACLEYGATYKGRRDSVLHHTNFSRKTPIPISISNDIYAFPTLSPTDYTCAWIFYKHVQFIKSIPPSINNLEKTMIIFENQTITLDVSPYVIKKQMERTATCRLLFSDTAHRNLDTAMQLV